jgi:predicted RNase H-like nuclease (RuvC/YqgF family)
MNIYELSVRVRELLERVELTEDENRELETLCEGLSGKVEAYCAVIAEFEADADVLAREEARLAAKRFTHENRVRHLKKALMDSLKNVGQTQHRTPKWFVRIAKSPPKCSVTENGKIADEFKEVTQTTRFNLKKAIEVYKATGQAPDGFEITEGEHLRIT